MAAATLSLSSKNYSSWSLRGWLMVRLAGLEFSEEIVEIDAPGARPSCSCWRRRCVSPADPRQDRDLGYPGDWRISQRAQAEGRPAAGRRYRQAHCRSICGEMHSGFSSLRAALPMNIKAHFPNFTVWSRARSDVERIVEIWQDCLSRHGGPYLFGTKPTLADAMYAPVVTRFLTYDIALDDTCAAYCQTIMAMPAMQEWLAAAKLESDDIEELEMEFLSDRAPHNAARGRREAPRWCMNPALGAVRRYRIRQWPNDSTCVNRA